jgi:hypothetical protein
MPAGRHDGPDRVAGLGLDLRLGSRPGSGPGRHGGWLGARAGGLDVCLWPEGYLAATNKQKGPHMVITGGTILLIVIIVLIVLFLRRA